MKKIYILKVMISIIIFSISCSKAKNTSIIQHLPGDDEEYALALGQGFDSIKNMAKGHCVQLDELTTQSGNQIGQTIEYRLVEINSISQLRDELSISASASFKSWGGSYKAKLNFMHNAQTNSIYKYILAHVKITNQLEIAKGFKFTSDALQIVKRYGINKEFVEQCGDEFVYGRRTGSEFFALVEINIKSKEEETKYEAAIRAKGFGFKASFEFNQALAELNSFSSIKIYMYSKGFIKTFPEVKDIGEFARTFPDFINHYHGNITISILTKDYTGVAPLDIATDRAIFISQQDILNYLAEKRDNALQALNNIHAVKLHPEMYEKFNEEQLNQDEINLNKFINDINQLAKECIKNPWENCKMPTETMPTILLPKKLLKTSDNEVCEKERQMLLKLGLINDRDYTYYSSKNLAPRYNNPFNRSSGIEGWYPCVLIVNVLRQIQESN